MVARREQDTAERIEREVVIHAPIGVVWAVVTEPEHISGWFSDSVEIDLRPGGKVVLHWEGHGTANGRVVRVEPPHLFSFRWLVPRQPDAEVEEHNSTLVEFSLVAERDSTRLKVVESGFRDLAVSDDEKRDQVDGHREGWEREIGELVDYVMRRTRTRADR